MKSLSACACEYQSRLKVETISVVITVHSRTTCVLKDIEVVRTRTGISCVENCYTFSWMQICVGKCTALIPRTVRLLFSTCYCERGGRSRERESETKAIRRLLFPCQSEHFRWNSFILTLSYWWILQQESDCFTEQVKWRKNGMVLGKKTSLGMYAWYMIIRIQGWIKVQPVLEDQWIWYGKGLWLLVPMGFFITCVNNWSLGLLFIMWQSHSGSYKIFVFVFHQSDS